MTSSLNTIIAVKTKYFKYRMINTVIQWNQVGSFYLWQQERDLDKETWT